MAKVYVHIYLIWRQRLTGIVLCWLKEKIKKKTFTHLNYYLNYVSSFIIHNYYAYLQVRILEWVTVPFSRGSSQPRDWSNLDQPHCRQILHHLSQQGSPRILEWVPALSPEDLPNLAIELGFPALQVDSFPAELPRKP